MLKRRGKENFGGKFFREVTTPRIKLAGKGVWGVLIFYKF